jgi:chorismate mutase
MMDGAKYYVVTKKAIPEVLIKVVNAKKLLDSGRAASVQEATEAVGISRSSFYKYKDDIFPFHDSAQGTTITLSIQIDDEPGLLSELLKVIADFQANILTIHQSIPIDGVASLNISLQILNTTGDISEMIERIENENGVHYVKILGQER